MFKRYFGYALVTFVLLAAAGSTGAQVALNYSTEYKDITEQLKLWNSGKLNKERIAKEAMDPAALIDDSDKTPVDVLIRRTRALVKHLKSGKNPPDITAEAAAFEAGVKKCKPSDSKTARETFDKLAALRRKIVLKNPLLDFSDIIFLRRQRMVRGERHMVDQYFGFNASKSGGVYILKDALTDSPRLVNALPEAVTAGRLKGAKLTDAGSFVALDLDYDAKRIAFAFTEADYTTAKKLDWTGQDWSLKECLSRGRNYQQYHWRPESTFHIFTADIDGGNLKQLTDERHNDFDPVFMPDGTIVFISERVGGNQRCGARWAATATTHKMNADGSDVVALSWHDTNEWHPSVDNDGMLVYTRWDYVDRDSDIAHHIWRSYPDGRDPRSYHGNYPLFRESRPWMEMSIRAIPADHRYIAVAAPHHGEAYGSLVIIDERIKDDRATSQIKRFTPMDRFPESEVAPGVPGRKHRSGRRGNEHFGSPWPLDEYFSLAVWDPDEKSHGIYLVDAFGNREPIFLPDSRTGCLDPIPLKARKRPPVIPSKTTQMKKDRPGEMTDESLAWGTVSVMNVHESELPIPKDVKVTHMRIVNIFAKTNYLLNKPNIGLAAQSLGRGVLGIVPVESDGSVHFRCPTGAGIYFQLLDEKGLSVHTMRSATYVHPGETLSCVGCHENKGTIFGAGAAGKIPIAMKRAPSKIATEAPGTFPLTFPRLVQPVIDKKCQPCHTKKRSDPKHKGKKPPSLRGDKFGRHGWSEAFANLHKLGWGMAGGNGALARNKRSYSIPMQDGARISKLYKMLAEGHNDVKLTNDELRRFIIWIDANTNFYAAYLNIEEQAKGKVVQPKLGLPKWIPFEKLIR